MKHVIAFVGEMSCGKDTAIKILERCASNLKFGRASSSHFLKQNLEMWGVQKNRENLQLLPQLMNQGFGPQTFNEALRLLITNQPEEVIIFDSIRFPETLNYLQKSFDLTVAYVDVDPKIRYQRMISRGEKHGENETTYEQFLEQHKGPTESAIPSLKQHATVIIDNNGSLEDLEKQIQRFYQQHLQNVLA